MTHPERQDQAVGPVGQSSSRAARMSGPKRRAADSGQQFENVPVEEITYALSAADAAKRLGMTVGSFRSLMSQLNGTDMDLRAASEPGQRARRYDLHRLDEWKAQGMPRPAADTARQDARVVVATAERSGQLWRVAIEETGQEDTARTLRQARDVALSRASDSLGVPPAALSVQVVAALPAAARRDLERAKEMERQAQRIAAESVRLRRQTIRQLRAQGISIDDLAELLDVSRQRVSQLANHAR